MEQEPDAWWRPVRHAVGACLRAAGIQGRKSIAAVSLSGHMSGVVCLDRDGRTVHPCILIGDTRSAKQTIRLRRRFLRRFRESTGNEPLDAFAVSKLLWLREEKREIFESIYRFVFPKDFIRFGLTGMIATEMTDAANSLLIDLDTGKWDNERIAGLDLPHAIFPQVLRSTDSAGQVTAAGERLSGLPKGTPVVAGAADMACSALGTGAADPGVMAITLSTSGQIVASTEGVLPRAVGKLTFHPHAGSGGLFAMGSIFSGGLAHAWAGAVLRGGEQGARALEQEMRDVPPGSDGVLFLPFLTGSGTPRFRAADRAAWIGMSVATTPATMRRAVLEGVACNVRECVEVFRRAGVSLVSYRLGGGGGRSALWAEILAGILDRPLEILEFPDSSALGACLIAGAGAGVFPDPRTFARKIVRTGATVQPHVNAAAAYRKTWRAYRAVCRGIQRSDIEYVTEQESDTEGEHGGPAAD